MTALQPPSLVSVADYLAGEEVSDVKHEYLGGVVRAMAGGVIDSVIALPEIEAELPLSELYERISF